MKVQMVMSQHLCASFLRVPAFIENVSLGLTDESVRRIWQGRTNNLCCRLWNVGDGFTASTQLHTVLAECPLLAVSSTAQSCLSTWSIALTAAQKYKK